MLFKACVAGSWPVALLFPAFCQACGAWLAPGEGKFFCGACWRRISFIENCCHCCGLPLAAPGGALLCAQCRRRVPPFRRARAVGLYEEGVLRAAVHLFKYEGKSSLGRRLGELMAESFLRWWPRWEYDFILPVPLHPRRLRQREFNQAFILAAVLGERFDTPLLGGWLERTRFKVPQAALRQRERLENVAGCFRLKPGAPTAGKKLLLVDDVYTTGATVGECARLLREAGAELVDVYTLARA